MVARWLAPCQDEVWNIPSLSTALKSGSKVGSAELSRGAGLGGGLELAGGPLWWGRAAPAVGGGLMP